jgi:hypothetical protein
VNIGSYFFNSAQLPQIHSIRQPNASGVSCAHETLTKSRPQSAKGDFKKRRALGVSLTPLLGGLLGITVGYDLL